MDTYVYKTLIECIKILENKEIVFPELGNQSKYLLHEKDLEINKFNLIINRKGHYREDTLTYIMNSNDTGIMVRLDMTGPPHEDKSSKLLNTPHVHIFDEEHNNGKIQSIMAMEDYYPGTFFEFEINVANEALYEGEEEEDFEW